MGVIIQQNEVGVNHSIGVYIIQNGWVYIVQTEGGGGGGGPRSSLTRVYTVCCSITTLFDTATNNEMNKYGKWLRITLLSRETTFSKLFLLNSEKGPILKGKNFMGEKTTGNYKSRHPGKKLVGY